MLVVVDVAIAEVAFFVVVGAVVVVVVVVVVVGRGRGSVVVVSGVAGVVLILSGKNKMNKSTWSIIE